MNTNLNTSLVCRFQGLEDIEDLMDELEDRVWIRLEQEEIPLPRQTAGLFDAFAMYQMAKSGMTAFNYDLPDNVKIQGNNIVVKLNFFVWPSNLDLTYSLTAGSNISISEKKVIDQPKSANVIFPLRKYEESVYPGELQTKNWETPCYNEKGEVVDCPETIRFFNGYFIIDKKVFGVLRTNMIAKGYKHTARLTFPKTVSEQSKLGNILYTQQNHQSITNPECLIVCTYNDKEGKEYKETLNLKLPSYLLDLLEACSSGALKREETCDPSNNPTTTHTTVYYSVCSGEVLDVRQKEISNPCESE